MATREAPLSSGAGTDALDDWSALDAVASDTSLSFLDAVDDAPVDAQSSSLKVFRVRPYCRNPTTRTLRLLRC
jgi:hypothetical protein